MQRWGRRASIAVAGLTVALGAGLVAAGRYASEVRAASEQTGIAIETMQGLRFAAGETNVELTQLQAGLRGFVRRAVEASNGQTEFLKGFERLGFTQEEVRAGLEDIEELFLGVAERTSQLGTAAEQSAVLMLLMSDAGRQLVPMFRDGRAGIEDFLQQARELGLVLDERLILAFEQLDKAVGTTGDRFVRAGQRFLSHFLGPAFVVNDWVNSAINLWNNLDEAQRQNVARWVAIVGAVLGVIGVLGVLAGALRATIIFFELTGIAAAIGFAGPFLIQAALIGGAVALLITHFDSLRDWWRTTDLGQLASDAIASIQERWEDFTLTDKVIEGVGVTVGILWAFSFARSFAAALASSAGLQTVAGAIGRAGAVLFRLGLVTVAATIVWQFLPESVKERVDQFWNEVAEEIRTFNAETIDNPLLDTFADWLEGLGTEDWELPAITAGVTFLAFKAAQSGARLAAMLGSAVGTAIAGLAIPIAVAGAVAGAILFTLGALTMSDEEIERTKQRIQDIWADESINLIVKVGRIFLEVGQAALGSLSDWIDKNINQPLAEQFGVDMSEFEVTPIGPVPKGSPLAGGDVVESGASDFQLSWTRAIDSISKRWQTFMDMIRTFRTHGEFVPDRDWQLVIKELEGVPGFAHGGFTGNLPADQVAGVVHGQEIVIPASAVRGGLEGILRFLDVPGFQAGLMQAPAIGAGAPAATLILPEPTLVERFADALRGAVQAAEEHGIITGDRAAQFLGVIETIEGGLGTLGEEFDRLIQAFEDPSAILDQATESMRKFQEEIEAAATAERKRQEEIARQTQLANTALQGFAGLLTGLAPGLQSFAGSIRLVAKEGGGFGLAPGSLATAGIQAGFQLLGEIIADGASTVDDKFNELAERIAAIDIGTDELSIARVFQTFEDRAQIERDALAQARRVAEAQERVEDAQGLSGFFRLGFQQGRFQKIFARELQEAEAELARLEDLLEGSQTDLINALGIGADTFASGISSAFQAANIEEFASRLEDNVEAAIRNALVTSFVAQVLEPQITALADMVQGAFLGGETLDMEEIRSQLDEIVGESGPLFELLDEMGLLADETENTANSMRDLSRVLNAPSGFRIETLRFAAQVPSFDNEGIAVKGGLAMLHDNEVVLDRDRLEGGQGGDMIFEAGSITVISNDPDDMFRKLQRLAKGQESRNNRTPRPHAPRFNI